MIGKVRHLRTLAFFCSSLALLAVSDEARSEVPNLETRRHWAMKQSMASPTPLALSRDSVPKPDALPQATVIRREWWTGPRTPEQSGKPRVVRLQRVVLTDTAHNGLRFAWYSDRDYSEATGRYRLVIFYAGSGKEEIALDLKHQRLGHDLDSYRVALHQAMGKEGFIPEDQIPATVEVADRKLTVSYADWRKGRLSADDSTWLASVKSERLMEALRSIRAMSHGFPDLAEPCLYAVCPLLGDEECPFEDIPNIITPMGKPDCDFDGAFGEFCTLEQQMEFNLRKQPQVAPAGSR